MEYGITPLRYPRREIRDVADRAMIYVYMIYDALDMIEYLVADDSHCCYLLVPISYVRTAAAALVGYCSVACLLEQRTY